MAKSVFQWLLLPAAAAALVACGGGGGTAGVSSTPGLSGTVAIGSPLAGAVITARDSNGNSSSSVVADSQGRYSNLNVSGLTAPFVIEAVGQLGQTPVKLKTPVATKTGLEIANVTSLTTALSAILAGGDPNNLQVQNISASSLNSATQVLTNTIAPVMQTIGLNPTGFNPISTAFTADSTGKDKLLDALDIRYRVGAVYLANRLQPVVEGQNDSNLTQVAISNTQSSGTLPPGTNRDTAGLRALAAQMTACFRVAAGQRVTFTQDAFGVQIIQSLHPTCRQFLHNDYMTNTFSWGQRWLHALKDPAFDNTNFEPQLRYVVTQPFQATTSDAYVVNFNFSDVEGNGYTRPEVAILENGNYKLYGNQRELDSGVEPVITKITDYVNPTTSTSNRVEGRIRFWLTPHRDWDSASSSYKFFYDNNNKPDPIIPCVWVTGPDLPGNGARNAGNTGPVGGILLKVPRSDYVARQDYLAVHVKFAANFDPHGNAEDRKSLLKACAARELVNNRWEVSTWNTNNQFTIDAAKSSTDSTFAWPTAAQSNVPFNWAPASANYLAMAHGGVNYPAMVGSRFGTYALEPVSSATKAAYTPTEMPIYTYYAFHRNSLAGINYGRSVIATSGTASDSTPVITNNVIADAFLSGAKIVKTRMLGAKPYLEIDANGVYSGTASFGSVDSASSFLATNATSLPSNHSLSLSWSVPTGSTGTDRIGYSCWANWINPANQLKVRWGPSVSSNSWAVPRNIRSKSFALEEECVGYEWTGATGTPTITSRYREIWARTYDLENRQIQSVQFAER